MELHKSILPERILYKGSTILELDDGGRFQLKKKPVGQGMEQVLEEEVPNGKHWRVVININVLETNL